MSESRPFFSIIAAGRNANVFAVRGLESVLMQTFTDWEFVYIDDASTNMTVPLLEACLSKVGQDVSEKIRLVVNQTRRFKLANFLREIPRTSGQVILELGGDDWFFTPKALTRIHRAYLDGADATCGSCRLDSGPGRVAPPDPVFDLFQNQTYPTPCSFKRSLFDRALREFPDCMIDPSTGDLWKVAADSAMFIPIVALAEKIEPISDVLVEMSRTNSKNHDHLEFTKEQLACGSGILSYWRSKMSERKAAHV